MVDNLQDNFQTYIDAARRYKHLILHNNYDKRDGIKIIGRYLGEDRHNAVITSFYQMMDFIEPFIGFVPPYDLHRDFITMVTYWSRIDHNFADIDPDEILITVLQIHYADDEEDLMQRLQSLSQIAKSKFWVYVLATKKCYSFLHCIGVGIFEELVKNLHESEWITLTMYDVELLFQTTRQINAKVLVPFLKLGRALLRRGNPLPEKYLQSVLLKFGYRFGI